MLELWIISRNCSCNTNSHWTVLAIQYTPQIGMAFDSVENIMRNVNYGWLIRYLHAVGASMFLQLYIFILREDYIIVHINLPRELLWFIGLIVFLLMMVA